MDDWNDYAAWSASRESFFGDDLDSVRLLGEQTRVHPTSAVADVRGSRSLFPLRTAIAFGAAVDSAAIGQGHAAGVY